jgi:hypothetical protein
VGHRIKERPQILEERNKPSERDEGKVRELIEAGENERDDVLDFIL